MIRRGATRPHPRTRRGIGAGTVGSGASRHAGSACAAPGGAIQGRPDPDIGMARFRRSWGVRRGPGGAPDRRADDDARRIAGRRGDGDDRQRGGGGDGGASDAGRPALRRDAPRRRIVAGGAPAAAAAQRDAGRVADGDGESPGCAGRNDDAPQRAAARDARDARVAHGEPDVAMQRRRRADAAKRAASAAVTGTMSGACSAPARTGAARHASGAAPGLLRFVARRAASGGAMPRMRVSPCRRAGTPPISPMAHDAAPRSRWNHEAVTERLPPPKGGASRLHFSPACRRRAGFRRQERARLCGVGRVHVSGASAPPAAAGGAVLNDGPAGGTASGPARPSNAPDPPVRPAPAPADRRIRTAAGCGARAHGG
jgi:hypothetical protein